MSPDSGLVLGIDVAEERKGLDLVALDARREVQVSRGRLTVDDAVALVSELSPVLVCIDCPGGWAASGRSRLAERELARGGFSSFSTPVDPGEHPFYRWMRVGISLYEHIANSYPRYRGVDLEMTSVEVFPSATATILAGGPQPKNSTKGRFRREVLLRAGVALESLPNVDRVDAALCAVTGRLALEGKFDVVGDPAEGFIVMPTRS